MRINAPIDQSPLTEKYTLEEGTVYMTGIQALVRFPLDLARRDKRAGHRMGSFISGYPGSPLGGFDLTLQKNSSLLAEHDVVHVPGLNEELAATAVLGSQKLDVYKSSRYQGVTGIWYGKCNGADRCGDVFKYGNYGGSDLNCAAVLLSGDDPGNKSSGLPSQTEYTFTAAGIPVVYPSSVQDMLEFGLHSVYMSRLTGCWIAMKLVTDLCDGGGTVDVARAQDPVFIPEAAQDYRKFNTYQYFGAHTIEAERDLFVTRHKLIQEYARANRLDRYLSNPSDARIGIISAGKTFTDLHQSLLDMGLNTDELERRGVRVLNLGLIYPIDRETVRSFARGLEEVVVVEEKRPYIETQVRDVLYGMVDSPRVIGKYNEVEEPLFPIHGEMEADTITEVLGSRLLQQGDFPAAEERVAYVKRVGNRKVEARALRLPTYCSGCPHNTGTTLEKGQKALGGIGCHSIAVFATQEERQYLYNVHMGGEGAPWIGAAPFLDTPHIFQNLGDGTYYHSGSLCIRACVASGVNITFKILFNDSVAMTGGQAVPGIGSVAALTRSLEAEGVKRTLVVAEDLSRYKGTRGFASNARLYSRDRLPDAHTELERVPGVTALIYDQECAAQKRSKRKRGLAPKPEKHVLINPEICEGCGHCGEVSNCVSLHPIATEYGRKTQVHQSSCNTDYSCLKGDCPSFVTVDVRPGTALVERQPKPLQDLKLPDPLRRSPSGAGYQIYMAGIGGTGVMTVAALLCYAATFEGKEVRNLDQTGLAQKGGPVAASVIIGRSDEVPVNKIGLGKADVYIVHDMLGGVTQKNTSRADSEATVAVVNTSPVPTGETARHVDRPFPNLDDLTHDINGVTIASMNVFLPAGELAEALFADHMMGNILTLGVAYQSGLIPLEAESIEAAIRLNGVSVGKNLEAFRYGRLWVADRREVEKEAFPKEASAMLGTTIPIRGMTPPSSGNAAPPSPLRSREREVLDELSARCTFLDLESKRLLAVRLPELIRYQNGKYAHRYLETVLHVAKSEEAVANSRELTHAVIRYLFKLMAYKDEYEVARLLLKTSVREQGLAAFEKVKKIHFHLHPPILRALGLKNKIRFGTWILPFMWAMTKFRFLRSTPLDPFGYSKIRQTERSLISWYGGVITELLQLLTAETHEQAVEIAQMADEIRGYEQIKMKSTARVLPAVAEQLDALRGRTEGATNAAATS